MGIAAQMKVAFGLSPPNCESFRWVQGITDSALNLARAARGKMMEWRKGEMKIFRDIEFNFMESWESENKGKYEEEKDWNSTRRNPQV